MLTYPFHFYISNPKFKIINLNLGHVPLLLQVTQGHTIISNNVNVPSLKFISYFSFLLPAFHELIQFIISYCFCYNIIITRLLMCITSFVFILSFVLASFSRRGCTSTSIFFYTITISIHTVSKLHVMHALPAFSFCFCG